MIVNFTAISSGIVKDVDPYDLPATPEAFLWSNGNNIRFLDDYVQKIEGHSTVGISIGVLPYWMMPITTASTYYWLLAGLDKVYVTSNFSTFSNITRQTASVDVDYTGTADNIWSGGVISGIPVINNGVDDPQMWSPVGTGTKLQSLTWDSGHTWATQSVTAKVIRPFREYLIALDTNESSTRYPYRLRWSTSTLSGVPSTWDDTDNTEDAGYTELNQSPGFLIDCLPMRNNNIIYKEDETWIMSDAGAGQIFRFDPLFHQSGALAQRCIKPFFGKHLVLTTGDLIVHDGQSIQSVIEKRMKKWLFSQIDSTNYGRSFIAPNYNKKEMWICFPSTGMTEPDMALIWNYNDNTYALRDLPSTPHIAYGIVDPSSDVFIDSYNTIIDTIDTLIDVRNYNPTVQSLLMVQGNSLYKADDTNRFSLQSYTAYVERTGMDLGDPNRFKLVKRVYIRAKSGSGVFTVKIGSQLVKNGDITWSSQTFDPSTDEYINFLVNGKYIGIRFESISEYSWGVQSFGIEYEFSGRF